MTKTTTLLAALAMTATATTSCSSDGCTENGSSLPLAAFYASGSGSSVTPASVTVRGIGAPGDSAIATNEALSQVYLPLRISCDTTSFAITFGTDGDATSTTDTLTLRYRAVPTFVSQDCGAMYNFEIGSYKCTSHAIDSVVLTHNVITNANRVSIKIFVPVSQ